MGSNTGFHEKLDALDLIITALRDHEKRLDALSLRLETVCKSLSAEEAEVARKEERVAERARKAPLVTCHRWSEFRDLCRGARMVAFEIEGSLFHIYSMVNDDVFLYSEDLPGNEIRVAEEESRFYIDKASLKNIDLFQLLIGRKLKCGLTLLIRSSMTVSSGKQFLLELSYDLDPEEVKDFLSRELNISRSNVVEGKITC